MLSTQRKKKNRSKKNKGGARGVNGKKDLTAALMAIPATVAALDKFAHSVLGGGPKKSRGLSTEEVPIGYATQMKPQFKVTRRGKATHVSGTDFLTPVSLESAASNEVGASLADILINPISIGSTRLQQLAPMFRRYIFRKFNLVFLPSQGTNTNGQLLIAHSHDPSPLGMETSGQAKIQQLLSWNAAKLGTLYTPLTMESSLMSPDEPYWVDIDIDDSMRHNYQGQALVVLANIVSTLSGSAIAYPATLGTIWVDYEVDMYDEQLNTEITTGYAWYDNHVGSVPDTAAHSAFNKLLDSSASPRSGGDTDEFPLVMNATVNATLSLGPGIYQIVMDCEAFLDDDSPVLFKWGDPTCIASSPQEQDAFQFEEAIAPGNVQTDATLGNNGRVTRILNVVVPDAGGTLRGNWEGSDSASADTWISLTIGRAVPEVLRNLNPPSIASSRARCKIPAHPKRQAIKEIAVRQPPVKGLRLAVIPHRK
jgi:hypothetical protein